MSGKHTFSKFDTELDTLRRRVALMGQCVGQQVLDAINALSTQEMALVEAVIEREKGVNREEVELDEFCVELIIRHAPTASDLRLIITTMQMITDLERVGDEAKKIAKAARQIIDADAARVPTVELRLMAEKAVSMLQRALDAFMHEDTTLAASLVREDQEVDDAFKGITRQLATHMMEDPRLITRSLDVLFIAKSLERVGDHATNLAEYVVFMVKGRDVRHESIEILEQTAQNRP